MFSGGDGVGLRDETCVMAGDTAVDVTCQYKMMRTCPWVEKGIVATWTLTEDLRGAPGREIDLCICIMTPSGSELAAISSLPASRCQSNQIKSREQASKQAKKQTNKQTNKHAGYRLCRVSAVLVVDCLLVKATTTAT